MKLVAFLPVAVLALSACSPSGDAEPAIDISNGWVRATPGGSDITAAYFTLSNSGGSDRLVAVTSDQMDRVEMHSSSMGEGGVMRMEQQAALDVPSGGEAVLAPGGYHLMLYGAGGAALGDTICLNLEFEISGVRIACLPVMDDAPLG